MTTERDADAAWLALADAIHQEAATADVEQYVADFGPILTAHRPRIEAALRAQGDSATTLDSDDFRARHERAIRDHILGRPEGVAHTCDDLCSDAIVSRLVGKKPLNEYPLQPHE